MEQRAGAGAFVKQIDKSFWIGAFILLDTILFARPNKRVFCRNSGSN